MAGNAEISREELEPYLVLRTATTGGIEFVATNMLKCLCCVGVQAIEHRFTITMAPTAWLEL